MLERLRGAQTRVLAPLGRRLVALGVSPNTVTWFGTLSVIVVSLVCFPLGRLWEGAAVVALLSTTDMIDGHMARALPTHDRRWGGFLDATLDRFADAAILGGIAWWLGSRGSTLGALLAMVALVSALLTSYVKARAEAVGARADVGLLTRPDRLVGALVAAFLAGLGVPWALEVGVGLLAAGGIITVIQRMVEVRRQLPAAAEGGR